MGARPLPRRVRNLAWGWGYFPTSTARAPTPTTIPPRQRPTNWELYREMWGSHGEFVIDGNLKSVEWVDRLHTIHVPTLVMAGDHDECDPSLSREMHGKIAGSSSSSFPTPAT